MVQYRQDADGDADDYDEGAILLNATANCAYAASCNPIKPQTLALGVLGHWAVQGKPAAL